MTTKNNTEKIILDKDALFQAYLTLDQEYSRTLDDNLNYIYFQLEKATGYKFERMLKRVELNDNKK
jgi:hypothetical protein